MLCLNVSRRHRRYRHGLANAAGDLRRLADRPARHRLRRSSIADQKKAIAAIAAGFTGLLSLFNIGGRFFWASLSDQLGRKMTYYMFFLLGIALYALAPWAAHIGSKALFVLIFGVILSMYGGGFATVPAYLADIFGTQFVGAIHGRLLTAWSTAGIIGPVIVNYIREYEKSVGVPARQALRRYHVCACRAARARPDCQLAGAAISGAVVHEAGGRPAHCSRAPRPLRRHGSFGIGRGGFDGKALVAWLLVGVPIAWGVWVTLSKASVLFH